MKKNKRSVGIVGRKVGQVIVYPIKILQPLIAFLKKEESKLKNQNKSLDNEDPFKDAGRVDDNALDSDAVEQVEHERVSAARTSIKWSLAAVRKTMTRIKLGKYGICERCKKMINTDRLAIDPTAAYCIKCAAKIEAEKRNK